HLGVEGDRRLRLDVGGQHRARHVPHRRHPLGVTFAAMAAPREPTVVEGALIMTPNRAEAVPTVDAAGMRTQNSTLLLSLLWRARQISRADLARQTGLSPSTVS